jgi:hypothetical protein
MIHAHRDPLAAKTVFSLFENAVCPFRVFVGVYEESFPSDPGVWSMYDALWPRSALRRSHAQNLRVLSYPADGSAGILNAYVQIMNSLWRGERFVVAVQCGADVVPQWDTRVVRALSRRLVSGARPERVVLTHVPAVAHAFGEPRPTAHRQNVVFDMLRTTSGGAPLATAVDEARGGAGGGAQQLRGVLPTFPCVVWSEGASLPRVVPRVFPHGDVPPGRVPVSAVSCGFFATDASTVRDMLQSSGAAAGDDGRASWPPSVPSYGADLFLTEAFVRSGATPVATGAPLVFVPRRPTTHAEAYRPRRWKRKRPRTPELSDWFCRRAGIDWKRKLVAGSAQMGLVFTAKNDASESVKRQEALLKYGSFEEFQRARGDYA